MIKNLIRGMALIILATAVEAELSLAIASGMPISPIPILIPNPQLIITITHLITNKQFISALSSKFLSEHISGQFIRMPNDFINNFPEGSAQRAALLTKTALIISPDQASRKFINEFASDNNYIICKIDSKTWILYSRLFDDKTFREIALWDFLEKETIEVINAETNSVYSLDKTFSAISSLAVNINSSANVLVNLNAEASDLNGQLTDEIHTTTRLEDDLANWGNLLGGSPHASSYLNVLTASTINYEPNQDPGIQVLEASLVPINGLGIPFRIWQDGHGVGNPYLDAPLATALHNFFTQQASSLSAMGAGQLQLSEAARTPLYGMALRASGNSAAVGAYQTTHAIGDAVDFGTLPGLTAANYTRLQNLLHSYGISLGTTGQDGRPDPMHATLESMADPNSPSRIGRLTQFAALYAQRYAQVRAEIKEKINAGNVELSALENRAATLGAAVKNASDACASFRQKLENAKSLNNSLRSQIGACQSAYNVMNRAQQLGAGANDYDPIIQQDIKSGEDITSELHKIVLERMQELENEGYQCVDLSNGNTFSISCTQGNDSNDNNDDWGIDVNPFELN